MSETSSSESISGSARDGSRSPVTISLAQGLGFAAAPTFAVMALVTGVLAGGPSMLCMGAHASPLGGMAPMYALMSVFHAGPWLKQLSRRQSGPRRS